MRIGLLVVAIASALSVCATGPSLAVSDRVELSAAGTSTQTLSGPAAPDICDATDLTPLLGRPDLGGRHSNDADNAIFHLLASRLDACSYYLGTVINPKPTPLPTFWWDQPLTDPTPPPITIPPECSSSSYVSPTNGRLLTMYASLVRCSALYKALKPSPSTPPPYSMLQPTFYVFTAGVVDATTSAVVVREVVSRLQTAERNERLARHVSDKGSPLTPIVIGRPDWASDASYLTQCQLDPNTIGALFIKAATPQTRTLNYVLWTDQGTLVKAGVEVRDCADDEHTPNSNPLVVWNSTEDAEPFGQAHQGGISLGIIAAAGSLFAKTSTTTTLTSTPVPTSVPIPGPSATTIPGTNQISTTTSTTPLTVPFLISSAANALSSQVFPAQNQPVQIQLSSERFAEAALTQLNNQCNSQSLYDSAVKVDPIINASAKPPQKPKERLLATFKGQWELAKYCDYFYDFDSISNGGNRAHHQLLKNASGQPLGNADFLPTPPTSQNGSAQL